MRAAGRNLREIAPGLATLLVLEDAPEMTAAASPSWILSERTARGAVTETAPSNELPAMRARDRRGGAALVRVAFPAPAPASAAPASVARRRRARDARPAGGAQRARASTCSTSSRPRSRRSTATRPAGRSSSPARATGRSPPAPTSASSPPRRRRRLPAGGRFDGLGPRSPPSACRSSPRSAASRSAAAASWRWPAT